MHQIEISLDVAIAIDISLIMQTEVEIPYFLLCFDFLQNYHFPALFYPIFWTLNTNNDT